MFLFVVSHVWCVSLHDFFRCCLIPCCCCQIPRNERFRRQEAVALRRVAVLFNRLCLTRSCLCRGWSGCAFPALGLSLHKCESSGEYRSAGLASHLAFGLVPQLHSPPAQPGSACEPPAPRYRCRVRWCRQSSARPLGPSRVCAKHTQLLFFVEPIAVCVPAFHAARAVHRHCCSSRQFVTYSAGLASLPAVQASGRRSGWFTFKKYICYSLFPRCDVVSW